MASKQHPHTTAVSIASDTMGKVIGTFGAEPHFMKGTRDSRVRERNAALDNAAPDIQAHRGNLPLHFVEKLHKLDQS